MDHPRAPGRQVASHQTTISLRPDRDLVELFFELTGSEAISGFRISGDIPDAVINRTPPLHVQGTSQKLIIYIRF
jgi:hypothetical protein